MLPQHVDWRLMLGQSDTNGDEEDLDSPNWMMDDALQLTQQETTFTDQCTADGAYWDEPEQDICPVLQEIVPRPRQKSATTTPRQSKSETLARLRSCAPCRIRRVKCERPGGIGTDCTKCRSKDLVCTPMPVAIRKPLNRSGKRIEQARSLFNSSHRLSIENGQSNSSGKIFTDFNLDRRTSLRIDELLPGSAAYRLVTSELESVLSTSLIDMYMSLPPTDGLDVGFSDFRRSFEDSGRRLSQMKDMERVICGVILAVGARVSDHPLLLGSKAPSTRQLAIAAREGLDLSEYGRARESACIVLMEKAIAHADAYGLFRKPAIESILILMMLEGMTNQLDDATASRAFGVAYASHMRVLIDQDENGKFARYLQESRLGWIAFLRDAGVSAAVGWTPAFSDDDIPTILLEVPPELSSLVQRYRNLDNDHPEFVTVQSFWTLFDSFMYALAMVGRNIAKFVTGFSARNQPQANLFTLGSCLQRLEDLAETLPMVEAGCEDLYGRNTGHTNVSKRIWDNILALRLSRCSAVLLLHRHINQRLVFKTQDPKLELYDHPPIPGILEDEEYWYQLTILQQTVHRMALSAIREVVSILASSLKTGILIGVVRGSYIALCRVNVWMRVIVSSLVEEQGGPTGFTYDAKLADLRSFLASSHSMGWAYARMADTRPWIEDSIYHLENARLQYIQSQERLQPRTWELMSDLDSGLAPKTLFEPRLDFEGKLVEPPLLESTFPMDGQTSFQLFEAAQNVGKAVQRDPSSEGGSTAKAPEDVCLNMFSSIIA